MDCHLCKETDYYHENKFFYVDWCPHPLSPGHSIIVPKKHYQTFSEIPIKERKTLDDLIEETKGLIEKIDLKNLYLQISEFSSEDVNSKERINMLGKLGNSAGKPVGYTIKFDEGIINGMQIEHFYIDVIPHYP